MKLRIAVLAFVCWTLSACGSAASENGTATANVSQSTATNGKTHAEVNSSSTNAAKVISPSEGHSAPSPGPPAGSKPLMYPAPDNSTFTVAMGGSGFPVETRTFGDDKYIAKVVRTWQDPNKKTVSIYLRTGKVVAVAGSKWPDIKSQPVSAFYEAAGIRIPLNPDAKRKAEQPQ